MSKVDNFRNRKFLEACHLNCEIKKVRLFSFQSHQGIKTLAFTHHDSPRGGWQLCWLSPPAVTCGEWQQTVTSVVIVTRWLTNAVGVGPSTRQRCYHTHDCLSAPLASRQCRLSVLSVIPTLQSVNLWRHNEYSCCSHPSFSYRLHTHLLSRSDW